VSGWLYAHLQRFVNPTPFSLGQGIEYLFMAVVGGAGSAWGAVVGATPTTLTKAAPTATPPSLRRRTGNCAAVVVDVCKVRVCTTTARRAHIWWGVQASSVQRFRSTAPRKPARVPRPRARSRAWG